MKIVRLFLFIAATGLSGLGAFASDQIKPEELPAGQHLYVIEREIPDAGKLTTAQLKQIAQTSCTAIKAIGPNITWLHSYVTDQKVYCVYIASSEDMVRDHAQRGGFPANQVNQVAAVFGPENAK